MRNRVAGYAILLERVRTFSANGNDAHPRHKGKDHTSKVNAFVKLFWRRRAVCQDARWFIGMEGINIPQNRLERGQFLGRKFPHMTVAVGSLKPFSRCMRFNRGDSGLLVLWQG